MKAPYERRLSANLLLFSSLPRRGHLALCHEPSETIWSPVVDYSHQYISTVERTFSDLVGLLRSASAALEAGEREFCFPDLSEYKTAKGRIP